MEVLELTAAQFIRPMFTGRNRPVLLGCENAGGDKFEVVVKFRGREMQRPAKEMASDFWNSMFFTPASAEAG